MQTIQDGYRVKTLGERSELRREDGTLIAEGLHTAQVQQFFEVMAEGGPESYALVNVQVMCEDGYGGRVLA
jgi:hypothetical protein